MTEEKDAQYNYHLAPSCDFSQKDRNSNELKNYSRSLWYKTNSDFDALVHKIRYWEDFSQDNWSSRVDYAVKTKQPLLRLEVALQNLPVPGAFRHAAVALRALIREKIRASADFDDELVMLYWLASAWSFANHHTITYSAEIVALFEIMPASAFKNMPFSYKELGYEKLDLLNKTDAKWLREKWGTPDSHKTLNQLHPQVFREYQRKLKNKRSKERRGIFEGDLPRAASSEPKFLSRFLLRLGFDKNE